LNYKLEFDVNEVRYCDVVVIGSGIAGLYSAIGILEQSVTILAKDNLGISNSSLAQGGIAVALGIQDSTDLHLRDTIYAGAGLCDLNSVKVLVEEARLHIQKLCDMGVKFDANDIGTLSLAKEAAHSMSRVVHAKDLTGYEICRTLISVASKKDNMQLVPNIFAVDIVTDGKECKGVLAIEQFTNHKILYLCSAVICATGGFGQIYSRTTNPKTATGDGIAIAYRAGVELVDLEFVQYHPTVLFSKGGNPYLISEAVRGEGAILKNVRGERFMPHYHPLSELATRDIVCRAIYQEMQKTNSDHVLLDVTNKNKSYLEKRFPNIYRTVLDNGIDMSKECIPIKPAQHYCMGGIKTDINGCTSLKGFYSCGESACSGVHGANRLASNSLLEGLVFGGRVAQHINNNKKITKKTRNFKSLARNSYKEKVATYDVQVKKTEIRQLMDRYVGLIREQAGLEYALDKLAKINSLFYDKECIEVQQLELKNMALVATLVTQSALERQESRGAHYRKDFKDTRDLIWNKHIVKKLNNWGGD